MSRSQRSKRFRRRSRLTPGQIRHRLTQHMRSVGHGINEWCPGCFNRFGFAFPMMQLAKVAP